MLLLLTVFVENLTEITWSANKGRARAKNNKLGKKFVDIYLLYIHD